MERKIRYYVGGSDHSFDNVDCRKVENDSNAMVQQAEDGLCLKKDYEYQKHVPVVSDNLVEERIKVVDAVELSDVEKLEMEKKLWIKIATLFRRMNGSKSKLSVGLYRADYILWAITTSLNMASGKYGIAAMDFVCCLCWLSCVLLAYDYDLDKTKRYLKLHLMTKEERNSLRKEIKDKGLDQIVDNCEDSKEVCYYTDDCDKAYGDLALSLRK